MATDKNKVSETLEVPLENWNELVRENRRLRQELDELVRIAGSLVAIWDEHGVDENEWTEDQAGVTNELYKDGVIAKARELYAKHKP